VDANLRSRIATAVVAIPLLIAMVGWGPGWLFTIFFLIVTAAALREYFVIAFAGRILDQSLGFAFGFGLALAVVFGDARDFRAQVGILLLLAFAVHFFLRGSIQERMQHLLWTLLGGFYVGFLVPHWILLFHRPDGRAWVFFVLLVIMSGDTFAYFIGRRFGKTKLAPAISPAKTVAGAWGYVAGGTLLGCAGAWLLFDAFRVFEAALLSIVLTILGQIGDLFESWIKRAFAVKDSGALVPGHGGILDRLDSLIFPAVFTTTYLRYFHT
jgi:phosphatidate cytidylyltransferase